MSDMRSCIKPQCRWPAVATLSYRYATCEVWLSDLGVDHPATHDMCPHHADSFTVPRGWTLVDDRQPVEPRREPSAAEIVQRATRLREQAAAVGQVDPQPPPRPPSRYAALLDSLPTGHPDDQDVPGAAAVIADADRPVEGRPTPPDPNGSVLTTDGGYSPRHSVDRSVAAGSVLADRRAAPSAAQTSAAPPATRPRTELPVQPAHVLAPIIRERAADLAGPVVGTIEIDLEHDGFGGQSDPREPVMAGGRGVVVQLPLSRWPADDD